VFDGGDVKEHVRAMFDVVLLDTFESWFDEFEALLASDVLFVVSDCIACLC
jgi:hypothetical protein